MLINTTAGRRLLQNRLLLAGIMTACSTSAFAGGKIDIGEDQWVSLGAGIRTSFTSAEDGSPDGSSRGNDFNMDNTRLYIAGQVNKDFKFYFGTDKMWGEYGVLDAIVQYEPQKSFNVWMGRHLVPADRIEMNGPFYGLSWGQYTVPLYPSDNDINNGDDGIAGTYGRDEGVTVWGTVGKFQYAVGVFDGVSGDSNQGDDLLFATRLAYNFLENESNPGYYTSSTYYGNGGDIFTVALSYQTQGDGYGTATESGSFTGYAVDVFLEKPLGDGAAITAEAEFKSFEVDTDATSPDFSMFDGDAYFATFAYLMPGGTYQPYLRYTENSPTDGTDSDLTEVGLNYVISGHKMKLNINMTDGDANASGAPGTDRSTLTLGMQFQI